VRAQGLWLPTGAAGANDGEHRAAPAAAADCPIVLTPTGYVPIEVNAGGDGGMQLPIMGASAE
jgi:hypothetical protein